MVVWISLFMKSFFRDNYKYYYCTDTSNIIDFGRSYYVGESIDENIKVDLYYHDEIFNPCDVIDNIRIASLDDVVAMKVDVVSRGGRKKRFLGLTRTFEYLLLPSNVRTT